MLHVKTKVMKKFKSTINEQNNIENELKQMLHQRRVNTAIWVRQQWADNCWRKQTPSKVKAKMLWKGRTVYCKPYLL